MHVDPRNACPDTSAVSVTAAGLHCSRCRHEVLDLRFVTERQAHERVQAARARDGTVCVKVFTDAGGRMSFLLDAPTKRRRLPIVDVALAATLVAGCGASPSPRASAPLVSTPSQAKSSHDAGAPGDAEAPAPRLGSEDAGVDAAPPAARERGRHRDPGPERRTRPPESEYDGVILLE